MPKRIILFLLGVILAVGAFMLYQRLTGSSLAGNKGKPPTTRGIAETLPPMWEQRDLQGRLQFKVTFAKSPEQLKDAEGRPLPGQFQVEKPHAVFYMSGRVIEIAADTCEAIIDQAPGAAAGALAPGAPPGKTLSQQVNLRKGTLSGKVRMRVSELLQGTESQKKNDPLPTGLTIHFDEPLDWDGTRQILSTRGDFHVRSAIVDTDLRGMQLSYNREAERIDYFAVQANPNRNESIFRKVAGKAMGALATTTKPATTEPANSPTTQLASTLPATTLPGSTQPATTQIATTTPNTKPKVPSIYRIKFGEDFQGRIHGKEGITELAAQLFELIFTGSPDMMEKKKAPTATSGPATGIAAGPATGPATAPTPAMAGPIVPPTLPPIPEKPSPIAPPGPEDLVVTWAGELELRPVDDPNIKFKKDNEFILDARGNGDRRVTVKDPRFELEYDRLTYQPGQVQLLTTGNVPGTLRDITKAPPGPDGTPGPSRTSLEVSNRGLTYNEATKNLEIEGPAIATSISTKNERTTIQWQGVGHITLEELKKDLAATELAATQPDKKDTGPTMGIKHVTIPNVIVKAPTMDFFADLLEMDVINVSRKDPKLAEKIINEALPEHLLASGRVRVITWFRSDDPTQRVEQSGLEANKLELKTKRNADNLPEWSEMLADGQVAGWRFTEAGKGFAIGPAPAAKPGAATAPAPTGTPVAQGPTGAAQTQPRPAPDPKTLRREEILTEQLVANLRIKQLNDEEKAAAAKAAATQPDNAEYDKLMQGVEVTKMVATSGVRVKITPPSNSSDPMINVNAYTLEAYPLETESRAVLSALQSDPNAVAHVDMGGNFIDGRTLLLNGKEKQESIEIPGPGRATLALPPDPTHPAQPPMNIQWGRSMKFDNQSLMATFLGEVFVKSQGQTQADDKSPLTSQLGQLKATEILEVQLKAVTPTTVPAITPAVTPAPAPAARGATSPTRGTTPPARGTALPARGVATAPPANQGTTPPAATKPATPTLVLDYIHAKGAIDAGGSQWIDPTMPLTGMNLKTEELFYSETLKQFRIPLAGRIAFVDNRPEEKHEVKSTTPAANATRSADTRPATSQPAFAASRGTSVFVWKKELLFDGTKNEISLSGDILFVFQPNKPLPVFNGIAKLAGTPQPAAGTRPAASQPAKPQIVQLNTQNIVVKLIDDADKDAKQDGGVLKMESKTVKEVIATGGATIILGDYTITGNDLTFDVQNNIATISGKGEDPAMVTIAGQAHLLADRFVIDLTKDNLFLQAVGPRGNIANFGGR